MGSILEVLIGLYFVTADNDAEDMAYDKEFSIIYKAIENTEIEDVFKHAVYWIEYMSGEISEEIFRLMTDATFGG